MSANEPFHGLARAQGLSKGFEPKPSPSVSV